MIKSLKKLLSHAIDYAGTNPPASLSFEATLVNYQKYHLGSERWILNHFVCPIDKLKDLHTYLENNEKITSQDPWTVSVIGYNFNQPGEEFDTIKEFIKLNKKALIEAYEIKADVDHLNEKYLTPFIHTHKYIKDVFIEIPWNESVFDNLSTLTYYYEKLKAKARMGGSTADQIPEVIDVSRFLLESFEGSLSLKLTAGMHNPIYGHKLLDGVPTHGFINLLVTMSLIERLSITDEEAEAILSETNINNFHFTEEFYGWKYLIAETKNIEESRESFHSFGSCSIQGPLESLGNLGLMQCRNSEESK